MTTFFKDDLIFYKNENGDIMSGGYSVESHMLQNGISPMKTLNFNQHGGKEDKVSSGFENMAIPAGLYFITHPNHYNKFKEQHNYNNQHTPLSDDIYDKLYEMIQYDDKKKRKTKKQFSAIDNKRKKTRRYKN
jgi:hypothetical protein